MATLRISQPFCCLIFCNVLWYAKLCFNSCPVSGLGINEIISTLAASHLSIRLFIIWFWHCAPVWSWSFKNQFQDFLFFLHVQVDCFSFSHKALGLDSVVDNAPCDPVSNLSQGMWQCNGRPYSFPRVLWFHPPRLTT